MHFAVVLLLVACTHARPISTPSGLVGKRVTVETYDGAKVSVVVQHTTTGVTYRSQFDDIDPATVTRITEARRGRGALEGLGIGALSGATIGAVIGFALGEDDCASPSFCGYRVTAVEKAAIVGAFGAGVAAWSAPSSATHAAAGLCTRTVSRCASYRTDRRVRSPV